MANKLQDLTLRVEEMNHLRLRVVKTGWAREGMTCVVQVDTASMMSRPTRTIVEYILKLTNTFPQGKEIIYPAVKELKQLSQRIINPPKKQPKPIAIGGHTKEFQEWQKETLYIDGTPRLVSEWLEDSVGFEATLDSWTKDE